MPPQTLLRLFVAQGHLTNDKQNRYKKIKKLRLSALEKDAERNPALRVYVNPLETLWSFFEHYTPTHDSTQDLRRSLVPGKLLEQLINLPADGELDLSPLKDDQQVSGKIYGYRALPDMYRLVREYAASYPERDFGGNWGGGIRYQPGRQFAFMVADEEDAARTMADLQQLAEGRGIVITAEHTYGAAGLRRYADITSDLRSPVFYREEFLAQLRKRARHSLPRAR